MPRIEWTGKKVSGISAFALAKNKFSVSATIPTKLPWNPGSREEGVPDTFTSVALQR